MSVVKFYKSAIAGKASEVSAANAGVVCFDLNAGAIYLDGKLVAEINDSVRKVTNVIMVAEGENAGKLQVSYTDGDPSYITLPEGKVYTAGDGIEISDEDVISVDWDKMTLGTAVKATQQTGAISNGTTYAADKSVRELLVELLQKESQPSKTEPVASITVSNAGAYEVGTKIAAKYSASLTAGSYTYGPATGVAATAYNIYDSESESATAASGTMPEITVEDSTNYYVMAEISHNEGAVAVTNLGNASNPTVQIAAGTKKASSKAITGFRSYFYGTKTSQVATDSIDSDVVRSLTNSAKAYSGAFNMNITEGAKQVIIAAPATYSTISVIDTNLNAEVGDVFTKISVDVEGANGFTATAYNVWVYNPLTVLSADIYKVSFSA